MHVLIPPAKNIPKQNLRSGTLLWLSRTHGQTHLSGNHSSSDGAENHRKLRSKTNRIVTDVRKALEIPIPVTRLQTRTDYSKTEARPHSCPLARWDQRVVPCSSLNHSSENPSQEASLRTKKFHLKHKHSMEVTPRTPPLPALTWFPQGLP